MAPFAMIDWIQRVDQPATAIDVRGFAYDPAGANDTLTYTWSAAQAGVTIASDSGVDLTDFTFAAEEGGVYLVTLQVSDEDGGVSASVERTITVDLPLSLLATTIDEGGAAQELGGSFSDPGSQDTYTVFIDWGDGSFDLLDLAAGVTTFTAGDHTYERPSDVQPYTISASATDDDAQKTWVGATQITVNNVAPTVQQAAQSGGSPVLTTYTTLSVLGYDPGGEQYLTYTWTRTAGPLDGDGEIIAPDFTDNASNSAKDTTVIFHAAGTYTFHVDIRDAQMLPAGASADEDVTVDVLQVLSGLTITLDGEEVAGIITVSPGEDVALAAAGTDQFGDPMTPSNVSWSVDDGPGSIDSSGNYTAPPSSEVAETKPVTISAEASDLSATADLAVAGHMLAYKADGPVDLAGSDADYEVTSNLQVQSGWQKKDYRESMDIGDFLTGTISYSITVEDTDDYGNPIYTTYSGTFDLGDPAGDVNCWSDVDWETFDPQSGGYVGIVVRTDLLGETRGDLAEANLSIEVAPYVWIADAQPVAGGPIEEGDTAYFPVYLSAPILDGVYVSYHTVDGSAKAGIDYEQHFAFDGIYPPDPLQAPMDIGEGEVAGMIGVPTYRKLDGTDPAYKNFTVVLDAESDLQSGQSTGHAQIKQDSGWVIDEPFAGDPWQSNYTGKVKAGSKHDTWGELIWYMAASGADASKLYTEDGKGIHDGSEVQVKELLKKLENRLRENVVAATDGVTNADFGTLNFNIDKMTEDQVNNVYMPYGTGFTVRVNCGFMADIISWKGLIDTLKPGEFDKLVHTKTDKVLSDFELKPGDELLFQNIAEFLQNGGKWWDGEWVRAGSGPWWSRQYYGFIGDNNVAGKSFMGWLTLLLDKYNETLPWYRESLGMGDFIKLLKGEGKWPWPSDVSFFDVANLATQIFELRKTEPLP